jgi:pyruvate carboxylase
MLVGRLGAAARRGLATMPNRPIKKLMAANRGEIAIRIFRAATELDIRTVAIFSKEDIGSVHRYKADEAYQVGSGKGPLGAYLAYEEIVEMAVKHNVDAIHPGYGFLSENPKFAQLCEDNGIRFVGPTPECLTQFGDKTKARQLAIDHGVPVVPGTEYPLEDPAAARAWCKEHGYPVILKAAHGGGGKGMRVVLNESEIEESFALCSGEALKSFGNGEVFIERYVDRPRHIEVQILGDGTDVVHLYDRDCSVQRRHQKVVEVAPASALPPKLRQQLFDDAVRITKAAGYRAAGTVEYLVEPKTNNHFFIEVNPRVQVEHTVTEVVTGIDIVQSQILIAGGAKLEKDLGLTQDKIGTRGYAIQCRVTTEDPANNFQPDTGRLQVWRPAEGFGIRLDGGNSYAGSVISPYYDSMLMKVTGSALTLEGTAAKVSRALRESRIRGVKTNIPFMLNVLKHPVFLSGKATTSFISDEHDALFNFPRDASQDRATKILDYLGEVAVNGRYVIGAEGPPTPRFDVVLPTNERLLEGTKPPRGYKQVLQEGGPEAFAKAVRAHKGLLLTDTTWRDAHQSLLATRMRTRDIMAIAPATAHLLAPCYSLENWGGATFDVALRFLHECPWDRLAEMREAVPNVPFQMLLRGANAVGYTSYPDNVVHKFCDVAVKHGMDVFRIFDSLNYMENMKLGIDAVGSAGGVVEAAIAYTGDITDKSKTK